MSDETRKLAETVRSMRPMVPAKDFELSKRFYADMGFQPREIAEGLVEMSAGPYSFLLQNYYVEDWANNFVIHMAVSDLNLWWERIVSLDLASRYGARTGPPKQEDWGLVFGIIDPSGVLWRISGSGD